MKVVVENGGAQNAGGVGINLDGSNLKNTFGVNLSLFKVQTIVQAALGIFITAVVIGSSLLGITILSVTSIYVPPIAKDDYVTCYKNCINFFFFFFLKN
jgi:hypothetical protein